MSEYIKRIRTTTGDKQIDYNALANLPVIPTYSKATQTTDGLMSASDKRKLDNGVITEYKVTNIEEFNARILTLFNAMVVSSHIIVLINLETPSDTFGAGLWTVHISKARDGFGIVYTGYYWSPSVIKSCSIRSGEMTGWYKFTGTLES